MVVPTLGQGLLRGLPFHHLSFNPKKLEKNPKNHQGTTCYLPANRLRVGISSMVTVGANMVDPVLA